MINDLTGLLSSQTTSTRARTNEQNTPARSGSDAAQQSPSNKGDTVRLSNAAQTLQNVEKQLSDTPDVDSDRVERLKQEIESGNYQINAERVAGKMLDFDSLL